jgi:hypothetical protein
MRLFTSTLFVLCVTLAPTSSSLAHHAQAPFFHQDRTVEIEGVVKNWLFRNPHPVLVVEVTGPNGQKTDWAVQFAPATVLAKRGWSTETFKVGETVKASGHPSKAPGTYGLEHRSISRADGSPVRF